MVHEMLSEAGLVDFGEATPIIDRFFEVGVGVAPRTDDAGQAVRDLMHLNAAEAMLPPLGGGRGHPETPLRVAPGAARLAILASDSGPFVSHDPRAQPRMWDVTLLGSDASKLSWLLESDSVEKLRNDFDAVIARFNDMYAGARGALHETAGQEELLNRFHELAQPTVLAIKATLWRAKLAVILSEEIDARELARAGGFVPG